MTIVANLPRVHAIQGTTILTEHPSQHSIVSIQFVDQSLKRYVLEVPADQLAALAECATSAQRALGLSKEQAAVP